MESGLITKDRRRPTKPKRHLNFNDLNIDIIYDRILCYCLTHVVDFI